MPNASGAKPEITVHPTTFAIETHGCKLNQADTLALVRQFTRAGMRQVGEDEAADVYVVNSCTVTHVADRKARQSLRSAHRRNPDATIVATGCYAQRAADDLHRIDGIDLVLGNDAKPALVRRVLEHRREPIVPCATGDDASAQAQRIGRTRAMVKIQEGCNQVCAYCIVPKVRGRERSIPVDAIVGEINRLSSQGYKEVALTGTQLGSYGFEWEAMSLVRLIERILDCTTIARLRVSSLQPQEISGELLRLWNDKRLCPHFHLPLQSGSDAVLKRMRRRYTAAEYAAAVERIRDALPNVGVTADVIVGFPGETDADFQATYALCERMAFSDMHAFPYSVRPATSAAHFGEHVRPDVKARRMRTLLALADAQRRAFRIAQLGSTHDVLWESRTGQGNGRLSDGDTDDCGALSDVPQWSGLTGNYIRVSAHSNRNLLNTITPTTLVSVSNNDVEAEPHMRTQ